VLSFLSLPARLRSQPLPSRPPFCPGPPQLAQVRAEDVQDAELGWPLFREGDDKLGWLMNVQSVSGRNERKKELRPSPGVR
jgi:hypothetical protein